MSGSGGRGMPRISRQTAATRQKAGEDDEHRSGQLPDPLRKDALARALAPNRRR